MLSIGGKGAKNTYDVRYCYTGAAAAAGRRRPVFVTEMLRVIFYLNG